MYTVIDIDPAYMTRFLKLRNEDTGTCIECFDDSDVVGGKDFGFMKIGKEYECKLKLFGDPVSQKTDESIVCKIIDRNVIIGKRTMIEIRVNEEKYFISKKCLEGYLDNDSFNFEPLRIDLIQVDDVIHPDFLDH